MPTLAEMSNPSLAGWGQYLSTSYVPDPNSPDAMDFLARLRKYDPSARYVPMDAEHGGGAQIVFDVSKLPKTASGEAFNPSANMETSMPGFATGNIIDPSKVVKGDSIYGDYTAGDNIKDPGRTNWIDYLGPALVGGAALAGAGGLLPAFGSGAQTGASLGTVGADGITGLMGVEPGIAAESMGTVGAGGAGMPGGLGGLVGGAAGGAAGAASGLPEGWSPMTEDQLLGGAAAGGPGAGATGGGAGLGGAASGISDFAKAIGLTPAQLISLLASGAGGIFNYLQTGKAADKVTGAINDANNIVKDTQSRVSGLFTPYQTAGTTALSQLSQPWKPLGAGRGLPLSSMAKGK